MDVQAYLRGFQAPWKPGFEARLGTLAPEVGTLLRDKQNGLSTADGAFAAWLHGATPQDRAALAAALFPQFPEVAARTLAALLTRHPYTEGGARRAFRAPGHPAQAERAATWLWQTWHTLRDYPQDLAWVAVHAGHLYGWQSYGLGLLLGQAISDGDEAVYQVLRDTAAAAHPVARMGRHVPAALLSSTREDAWALAEGLLRAAQRQEGLRQVILETVDEASADAFVRMLRLVLDEDLLRFASVLRAAGVWFGLGYDVTDLKAVRKVLQQALGYLEAPETAQAAVGGGSGLDAYLALYTLAMRDAEGASALARGLLADPDPERRMAGAQVLLASDLDGAALAGLIGDPDPRLAALAAEQVGHWTPAGGAGVAFDDLAAYLGRLGPPGAHQPLLFPWLGQLPGRSDVADRLIGALGDGHLGRLAPHLGAMSACGKTHLLERVRERHDTGAAPIDAPTRELLLALLQDRNSEVAQRAVEVMGVVTPDPRELDVLHGLLRRKSADLRRGLIRLLARDPAQGTASAAALLAASNTEQRQAGLQLLRAVGGQPPEGFVPKNVTEETLCAALTRPEETLTLRDGLGLFDPGGRTAPPPAQFRERDYPALVRRGAELLRGLDALLVAHREHPVVGLGHDGETTLLLGNLSPWTLRPGPDGQNMPLAELWDGWWHARPDPQDGDVAALGWALGHFVARQDGGVGYDAAAELQAMLEEEGFEADGPDLEGEEQAERAAALTTAQRKQALRHRTVHRVLGPPVPLWLAHPNLARPVVHHLTRRYAAPADLDLRLDAWESALSLLPRDVELLTGPEYAWRDEDPRDVLSPVRPRAAWDACTPQQLRRFWEVGLHEGGGFPKLPRRRPDTGLLLRAYAEGWATRADLLDQLIGERAACNGLYASDGFDDLALYSRRRLREGTPTHPDWRRAVDEVRGRVLVVEAARGDLETPATAPALALNAVEGAAVPLRLLARLGKNPLRRGYQGRNESRDVTFSHLIRVSFPTAADTPQSFGALVRELRLSDARLLDLAMFAPQWAPLVSAHLGWRGLQGGVFWLHAHTRDGNWSVPQEVREAWAAEIAERTPLAPGDLMEGAVDVAWFRAMHAELGAARFHALLEAAKYASSSGGHKRAELYARAVLGEEGEAALRARITEKRSQDAVRALGLLPLGKGKARAAALEARYRLLADFRRGARAFGAQRQASERRAADIGLQNLARTAGYADPQRLMWAMEARTAPDWQALVREGDLSVGIDLSPQGEAELRVERAGRPLKALPARLKKHDGVLALRAAVTELRATRGRMAAALEDAMVRGDHFGAAELRDLARHPVIAPMLRGLLWVLNETEVGWWQGETLLTPGGEVPVADHALRLAHPHDLYLSGHWPAFQAAVMTRGLAQPFKQAFREYYPRTPAEGEARRVTRYSGHHVQPGQAAALFKARGWVPVPEEGVRKTYHAEGLSVWVDASLGYGTPNEVEGTPLNAAYFLRQGGTEPLPLAEVPPRLLSETLRDLDLVVGVAHVGGVDPEASQSTVAMRTDLLRETLRLLGLGNVRLEHSHALIQGQHAHYTVHLGSGTVHRLPGGFLCIIPVHNQHQGRIFLPFADPDPRTAEVVSKVLLLAEDRKIQDPTILEQLR